MAIMHIKCPGSPETADWQQGHMLNLSAPDIKVVGFQYVDQTKPSLYQLRYRCATHGRVVVESCGPKITQILTDAGSPYETIQLPWSR
jgi:hypothetical protein